MTPSGSPSFRVADENPETLRVAFHLLSVKRRRWVIRHMIALDPGDTISVKDLSKAIAAVEQDVPPRQVSNDAYRRVYTNLTQSHLPKLAAANVIEYESERKKVAPGPNVEALATLMAIAVPILSALLTTKMYK